MYLKAQTLAVGLLCLFLQSCALAPEYQRPAMPVAATLPAQQAGQTNGIEGSRMANQAAETGWHEYFPDPALQQLIKTALDNNRDLRVSALAVETFQAQYRIQRAALFPTVATAGSAAKQRTFLAGNHVTTESYSLSAGITAYELDLFGRVKNLKEYALEQYLATEETYRSARISLVAEVANAYLTLLADRELMTITEDTFRNEEESYRIIDQRVTEGIANQLDLAQARTSLETARANLALFRRLIGQDINNLTLLTGGATLPDNGPGEKLLSDQTPFADLPAAMSSQVLLQRPDIMAAEHELKGAHANIGAARAAFFPSVSLTATAGLISPDLSGLFDGNSGTWLFSPAINLPIFTAGRLQAQLDVAEIRREISIASYEKAIQAAFREVADALVARDNYGEQLAAHKANLDASQTYYLLARERYQQGLDSFLTLLDAQRSLYVARLNYVAVQLAQMVNQVNLYKALGGGWKERS